MSILKPYSKFVLSTGYPVRVATGRLSEKDLDERIKELAIGLSRLYDSHIFDIAGKNRPQYSTCVVNIERQARAANKSGYLVKPEQLYLSLGSDIIDWNLMLTIMNNRPGDYLSMFGGLIHASSEKISFWKSEQAQEKLNANRTGVNVKIRLRNWLSSFPVIEFIRGRICPWPHDRSLFLLDHPWDDVYPNGRISMEQALKELIAAQPLPGVQVEQTNDCDVMSSRIMDVVMNRPSYRWLDYAASSLGRQGEWVGYTCPTDKRLIMHKHSGKAEHSFGVSLSAVVPSHYPIDDHL